MKRILVRGDIIASGMVTSLSLSLEHVYAARCGQVEDADFDIVIEGDLNIKSITAVSGDVQVWATGEIIAY